jgi:hypothetical protein
MNEAIALFRQAKQATEEQRAPEQIVRLLSKARQLVTATVEQVETQVADAKDLHIRQNKKNELKQVWRYCCDVFYEHANALLSQISTNPANMDALLDTLEQCVNSGRALLERARAAIPEADRTLRNQLTTAITEQQGILSNAARALENKYFALSMTPDLSPEQRAGFLQAALDANGRSRAALKDRPNDKVIDNIESFEWGFRTRLVEYHKKQSATSSDKFIAQLVELEMCKDPGLVQKMYAQLAGNLPTLIKTIDTALAHADAAEALYQRLWAKKTLPPYPDGTPALPEGDLASLTAWPTSGRSANWLKISKEMIKSTVAQLALRQKARSGSTALHGQLEAAVKIYLDEFGFLWGGLKTLDSSGKQGHSGMDVEALRHVHNVLLARIDMLEEEIASARPCYRTLFSKTSKNPPFQTLQQALQSVKQILPDMVNVELLRPTGAAPSTIEIISTKYNGVMIGERRGDRVIVQGNGFTVNFVEREPQVWVEADDEEQADVGAGHTLPVIAAHPKPVADARSGLEKAEKRLALDRISAQQHSELVTELTNPNRRARFWEVHANVNLIMGARDKTIALLTRTLAHMEPLREIEKARVEALETAVSTLKLELASLEEQLMIAAKAPPCSDAALRYLLEKRQVTKVTCTIHRKQLQGASTANLPGKHEKDFMDEHLIDIEGLNEPFVLHTHYRTIDAKLEQKSASHLKFGDAAEQVRSPISLATLQRIAALMAGPQEASAAKSIAASMAGPQEAPATTTPARKGKRRK